MSKKKVPSEKGDNVTTACAIPKARFDLIPSLGIRDVALIMGFGLIQHPEEEWKQQTDKEHIDHALSHIFAYLANMPRDVNDIDDLAQAATRLIMACDARWRM
jgi:hypothetical protein